MAGRKVFIYQKGEKIWLTAPRRVLVQRDKLYTAEEEIVDFQGFYSSVEACQGRTDRIIKSPWWQAHSSLRHCEVRYPAWGMTGGVRHDAAHAHVDYGESRLCEGNLIHEQTHFLDLVPVSVGDTPRDHEIDHGPIFAGALLEMLRRYLSASLSHALQEEFRRVGVEWGEYK